ncbi:hypothetical protein KKF84_01350 [Myxococcota bacterium]|nr:hypothetical protein [Myxococcota bacterium]MBU1533930.1 hypothetical protein [Myxococcota bacterium]
MPPIPERQRFIALFFLPWLLWPLPYHRFLRSTLWPSLIAISLLFKDELTGVSLVTQVFLALSYYFFILEEEPLPIEESTHFSDKSLTNPRGPELFLLLGSLLVVLGLLFMPGNPVIAVLFFTALAAANFLWWKKACSFRISQRTRYTGLAVISGLCLLMYAGHFLGLRFLYLGSLAAVLAFTLLSPLTQKNATE